MTSVIPNSPKLPAAFPIIRPFIRNSLLLTYSLFQNSPPHTPPPWDPQYPPSSPTPSSPSTSPPPAYAWPETLSAGTHQSRFSLFPSFWDSSKINCNPQCRCTILILFTFSVVLYPVWPI